MSEFYFQLEETLLAIRYRLLDQRMLLRDIETAIQTQLDSIGVYDNEEYKLYGEYTLNDIYEKIEEAENMVDMIKVNKRKVNKKEALNVYGQLNILLEQLKELQKIFKQFDVDVIDEECVSMIFNMMICARAISTSSMNYSREN